MILERAQYNNGEGCQCCRQDWEKVNWIDESKMLSIEKLYDKAIGEFYNVAIGCNGSGQVGVKYERDGKLILGVEANIYRMGADMYILIGDNDEYVIKSSTEKCKTKEEIIQLYNQYIEEKEYEDE